MTRTTDSSAHVDLRGFTYALSPFVRQQEWHMETLLSRLAQAQRGIADALAKCEVLTTQLRTQSEHIQMGQHQRPDPSAHRHGLIFLAQLQHRISDQKQELQSLKEQRTALQTECVAQQRKLDGLAEHRAKAQQEYALEAVRREAGEADRDWMGRMHYRAARLAQLPEDSACP